MIAICTACYHFFVKQIITRVDDELAEALKRRAQRSGESVNSYVNRLLRVAVAGSGGGHASSRQMWKAAALADGRLAGRAPQPVRRGTWAMDVGTPVTTPAGYAGEVVSRERDER